MSAQITSSMNDLRSNTSDAHEVDALQCFVTVCEQFEADWRAGASPRLDAYLQAVEPSERRRLFCELLAIEIELRVQQGKPPRSKTFRRITQNGPRPRNLSSLENCALSSGGSIDTGSNLDSVSGPTELREFPALVHGRGYGDGRPFFDHQA